MTGRSIRVDIVSDVVCPWCIIGYRQLCKAATALDVALDVHWHPFELNPQMVSEGENLRDHLMAKYGMSVNDSVNARQHIVKEGEEVGFTFTYSDTMKMLNTFRAHQLLAWAATQGKETDLKLDLFESYFTHHLNISDMDILIQRAVHVGLDEEQARDILTSNKFSSQVRTVQDEWRSRGVTGVPAMIFDQKFAVTGAQGPKNYQNILKKAMQ